MENEPMAVPPIHGTEPPGRTYTLSEGEPPATGDVIVTFLPPAYTTPPGWTRNGPVLWRFAEGGETAFPGPAAWFRPSDVDADGMADPSGMAI
jgi:hypothetical protein